MITFIAFVFFAIGAWIQIFLEWPAEDAEQKKFTALIGGSVGKKSGTFMLMGMLFMFVAIFLPYFTH